MDDALLWCWLPLIFNLDNVEPLKITTVGGAKGFVITDMMDMIVNGYIWKSGTRFIFLNTDAN